MKRHVCEKSYPAPIVSAHRSFSGSFRRGEPSARCQESLKVCELAGRLLVAVLSLLASSMIVSPARAQTCRINIPHLQGTWTTLPYLMPINPISATLLHTGQVLIVAGSENDARNNSSGSESYRNAVWDPTGTTESSITVQHINYDVFCSGTAVLPDGRPMVIGGTASYSFTGDNRASIFDPATQQFLQAQSMANGRWYATSTGLGDGRIMAFSGLNLSGGTNNTVEIYDLRDAGAGWTGPVTAPFAPSLFPRMFLLPNGTVFFTGQGSGTQTSNSYVFDPLSETWTASAATTIDRYYGSAVLLPLLPPDYTPKVMNFGGGSPATSSTEIIDLSAASPSWTPGPNMSTGRVEMNAEILPNGKVLAEGGSVNNESPDPAGKQADLYDPVANTFSSAGTASYSRLYHSTALLLPDATVFSMGSNPGPRGQYQPAIEIYTPAYLFDSNDHLITTNRPVITGITPPVLGYSASFSVTYTSTSPISSAVLVHPGSTTHAFDMDQRLIGLCGPAPQPACNGASGSGTLSLTTPPNGNIAPPGYYMLFILDGNGVPSIAQFLQLSPYATSPPHGTISSPAGDTTIVAGGSVAFSTTSTAAQYSWVFPGGSPATSTAQVPGNATFNTPGTYVTSLTVIDSSGNSDPSPPTRTITVLPPSADFSIAVSPASNAVVPGQSATFTVTITPLSGFSGSVSLSVSSENGFPSGITSGGFSPATISGSGSSTLTMNTTTSATPYALSLTITGTSGSLTRTSSTTLLVNLVAPTSLTATAASASQINLSWLASVGATSYHVYRSLVSGRPYDGVACTTATSYTDTGLSASTTYYYVVSADYTAGPDAGGESAYSSEASATTASSATNFTLSATPTSTTVAAGGTGSYTVTLTPGSGFSGAVSFSVSGLPAGATASFNPSSLTTSGSTTLSVATSFSTSAGTYPLTITGNSGQASNTATVTLVVTANFAVSVSPGSKTITRGKSGTYTVTVTASQGFSGTVSLSVSGLPPKTTASFNPSSVTNSGSSTLTVHVGPKAAIGTSTLTITGTSGSLVRSTAATLTIQ